MFAFAGLGISTHALLRSIVGVLPIKGILLWLIPIVIIMTLAKLDPRSVPNARLRQKWSETIIVGTLGVVVAINGVRLRFFGPPPEPSAEEQVEKPPQTTAPDSK